MCNTPASNLTRALTARASTPATSPCRYRASSVTSLRHRKGAVGQRRLGECRERIDIEFRGAQFAVERGRPIVRRPGVGEPPLQVLLIERRRQPIEREAIACDRDVAARGQRFGPARRRIAAALEPCHQHFQIGRFELGGPAEAKTLRAVVEPAAQVHLGEPRRAELEVVEAPSLVIEADIAVQRLDGGAADRQRIDGDADRDRNRRLHRRHKGFDRSS